MNEKERLASEAQRLLNEPILIEASRRMQTAALAELMEADPDDKTNIIRLQTRAQMATEILTHLAAIITASGQRDGGVVVENKPTAE